MKATLSITSLVSTKYFHIGFGEKRYTSAEVEETLQKYLHQPETIETLERATDTILLTFRKLLYRLLSVEPHQSSRKFQNFQNCKESMTQITVDIFQLTELNSAEYESLADQLYTAIFKPIQNKHITLQEITEFPEWLEQHICRLILPNCCSEKPSISSLQN